MSKIKLTLFGLALGCVPSGAALAQNTTTLRVVAWVPNSNSQNSVIWPTWVKWVKEAGRASGCRKHQLHGPSKIYFSSVKDVFCDVVFSIKPYLSGSFLLTSIAEIPVETVNSASVSSALWRV